MNLRSQDMPTSTRRQVNTRIRNRHSAEQTIDVPSDAMQTPTVNMDAVIAENMEHEDHLIDEDDSDEGTSDRSPDSIYAYIAS